jgi:HIT zinc finger
MEEEPSLLPTARGAAAAPAPRRSRGPGAGSRRIDAASRAAVLCARLAALEDSNFNEEAVPHWADVAGLYVEGEDGALAASLPVKRAPTARGKGSSGSARASANVPWVRPNRARRLPLALHAELGSDLEFASGWPSLQDAQAQAKAAPENSLARASALRVAQYLAAAGPTADEPPRLWCRECGKQGHYACVRCGARTCSVPCITQHKEKCG